MLFNSYEFIFAFLPATLGVFHLIGNRHRLAIAWLVLASLFFYGWWNPAYLALLLGSILFNYTVGYFIVRQGQKENSSLKKPIFIFGVAVDILTICYFKYFLFFLSNINHLLGAPPPVHSLTLPLGISFFTFTQIAFLADAYQGKAKEYDFINYTLFVTYFPHLIAGPVLHHKEMMPQFARAETFKLRYECLTVGMTVFVMGLFKKVVFADGVAQYATPVFNAAAGGANMMFYESWVGVTAYSLQIYFDFSGYSDMAVGLSFLFGVRLPLNFNSPYKSKNIIDFWRRWHMTLSRFLRDYLYIPLGGNRKGEIRRFVNIMTTMLLGGLWHGAGWTFVIWGGLHGAYLAVNHLWRAGRKRLGMDLSQTTWIGGLLSGFITYIAVLVAWVFFRAANLDSAIRFIKGMAGQNGFALPPLWENQLAVSANLDFAAHTLFNGVTETITIASLLAVTWLCPNTQEIMARFEPALEKARFVKVSWSPTPIWAVACAFVFIFCILSLSKASEFLYFQF